MFLKISKLANFKEIKSLLSDKKEAKLMAS